MTATVRELHRQAMEWADKAAAAKDAGEFATFRSLSREAMQLERQAAALLQEDTDREPARSVLLRSAASLALDCTEHRIAERLIATALAGDPPEEIADELRDLLEQVNLLRHLEPRGLVLHPGSLLVSIASGEQVGYGIARVEAVDTRVGAARSLVTRTTERKLKRPFREHGPLPAEVREQFELYYEAQPVAASFAIAMRLGASPQLSLFGPSLADEIVVDVIETMRLYDANKTDELRERIGDEAYFRNFIGLAREIEPDGKDVSSVGLAAQTKGERTTISLVRPRADRATQIGEAPEAPYMLQDPASGGAAVRVEGELLWASSESKTGRRTIHVITIDGRKIKVRVPKGMMRDIVKPLWEEKVVVVGREGPWGEIALDDIQKLED